MKISLSLASLLAGLLTLSALSLGAGRGGTPAWCWMRPQSRPLEGANVQVGNTATTTDAQGRFKVEAASGRLAQHFLYRLPARTGSGRLAAGRGPGAHGFASARSGGGRRLDAPATRPLGRQRHGGRWGPFPGQRGRALAGRNPCGAQFELGRRLVSAALFPDPGHWRAQPLRWRRAA